MQAGTKFWPVNYTTAPWQCLYFFPESQGQGELRPTLPQVVGSIGLGEIGFVFGFGFRLMVAAPD